MTPASRLSVALSALLVAACVSAPDAPPRPDFSGAWRLDRARSDLGPPRDAARRAGALGIPDLDALEDEPEAVADRTVRLEIDHRDPALRIDRVVQDRRGQRRATSLLYTDGREAENPGLRGEIVRSRSRFEGRVLVTRATRSASAPSGDLVAAEVEERRSLEASGRDLVTELRVSGPGVSRRVRLVFSREAPIGR